MPSIRKIRIVNFRYDDGSKLIPDEIFCMENGSGIPTDTLLNLDNGGGKTVLVQLMMQPICPKAKVQNRNIGEYFRNGTDHAFVLIEWALDGSAYSLLTGIALAAGNNTDNGTENKNVRFFTFLHTYPQTGDKLDIVNIPLTERESGHIHIISYDDLRKLLQNRGVKYYPSDQLRRYQKDLADEYGILHTEWENILVRVNAVEGGISKFFEEYKTADRLIDRFVIPGVMPNDGRSEESLEEMFMNYAESYAGQEENLRMQSRITAFTEKLNNILPLMKSMWEHDDARIHAVQALADHIFTLGHVIDEKTDRKNMLESSVGLLNKKMNRILSEKVSAEYYIANEALSKTAAELDDITQNKDSAKEQRDHYDHLRTVLNAAKEFSDLTEQRNLLKALYSQLKEFDYDGGDVHIGSLRYSLCKAALSQQKQTEQEICVKSENIRRYSEKLTDIGVKLAELTKNFAVEKEKCDKFTGRSEVLLEQINCGLERLALKITVMLDGTYSDEDIANIRIDFDNRAMRAAASLQNHEEEEHRLAEEIYSQNERRIKIAAEQADISVQLRDSERLLEEYKERYDEAIKVIRHLSLSAESIFDAEPMKLINNIIAELIEKLHKSELSAEILSEQIVRIGTGQLHLHGSAVDFLTETGIPFQTGEKYLLMQPTEIRQNILRCEPAAAYALIVNSAREREKLLSQESEKWLPSAIPVYTLSDIADMAEGKRKTSAEILAAYDRDYFSDAEAYKEKIRTALDIAKSDIENITSQLNDWTHESAILSQFIYTADYERTLNAEISEYTGKKNSLQKELLRIDDRRNEIAGRMSELKVLRNEQQTVLQSIKQDREEFEKIYGTISQYEILNTVIAECKTNCEEISKAIGHNRTEEKHTENLLHTCKSEQELLEIHLAEYRDLVDELKDSPETEVISAEYPVLLAEYQLYREQRSSDRKSLENRIVDTKSHADKIESGLKRFRLDPEEYKKIGFSKSSYDHANDEYNRYEREFEQLSELHTKATAAHASAESALKQAENRLAELHTELLERSEVGSDHERRIAECKSELLSIKKELDDCVQHLNDLTTEKKYSEKYVAHFADDIADYLPKITENDTNTDILHNIIEHCTDTLKHSETAAENYLRRELEPFRKDHGLFAGTLDGISSVIGNTQIHGDKYFSLYERTEGDIHRYRDRIGQLDILLKDVEDSRKELVAHCLQRAGRLYENLTILSKKSGVQIGGTKKQMLRIELPEIDSSSNLPASRINDYIEGQVHNFISEKEENVKSRRNHLEIRRLLNCYIGKESIPVIVFKIDKVIQNSRYRSWEDALKANSGGEQFVVFFSLVASVMNYTRGITENLSRSSGVLILDNPFGPISSPHLLEPMFRISHHFNIQLICLTHLGTAAVTGCFDMVYQLKFKTIALSNVQILEAEAKQHMEHAYVLSQHPEQLSIF